jgi:hypothetical protein
VQLWLTQVPPLQAASLPQPRSQCCVVAEQ